MGEYPQEKAGRSRRSTLLAVLLFVLLIVGIGIIFALVDLIFSF
jgi:hypothetical protein